MHSKLARAKARRTISVLPRLRFCAIVPQNFEYDAAKTVSAGHLTHIDLACLRTLSPLAVWKIPMPKITLFFTGIPVVVTAILIGVLDF